MTPKTMIWISALVIIIMMGVLLLKPGIREYPFSKDRAEIDIKRGQVMLIRFGLGVAGPKAATISSKYGFKEYNMGCEVNYSPGEKAYDEIVSDYLDRRNGIGWQERYYKELGPLMIMQANP